MISQDTVPSWLSSHAYLRAAPLYMATMLGRSGLLDAPGDLWEQARGEPAAPLREVHLWGGGLGGGIAAHLGGGGDG